MIRIMIFLSVLSLFFSIPHDGECRGSPPPKLLSISPSVKEVLYENQKIKFSASGGTAPYSFSANIGTINKATGDYTAPASEGQATVTVKDSKGNTASFKLPVYLKLEINPTTSTLIANGISTFSAKGGIPPFKFTTSYGNIGSSNGIFTAPSTMGTAVITVTDSRNSKAAAIVTIISVLTISPAKISLAPNATATFTASGGVPPYTFSANYGSINSLGLYTFSVGSKSGDVVQVRDELQNVASVVITGDFSNMWTWVSGSNSAYQLGVYGKKGLESYDNIPGGRYNSASWVDDGGNFWFFGGVGQDFSGQEVFLNDLWKFSSSEKKWTWVGGSDSFAQEGNYGIKGMASPTNFPPARYGAFRWKDSSGDLWLFGGLRRSGYLNDLWKYNIASNQWTWVSGGNSAYSPAFYGTKGVQSPNNVPGGRIWGASWADAKGNLWLFGGYNGGISRLNDLWKYDIASNQWTWVGGSNSSSQEGSYGTKGMASPTNVPGARHSPYSWKDSSGDFWLFGGEGDSSSSGDWVVFNDLWKFNPASNQWVWMSGSNLPSQFGIYGTQGLESYNNFPGGRAMGASWVDTKSNLWLFGGQGKSSADSGILNDLWKYNIASNQWTWVSGGSSGYSPAFYGEKGVASPNNIPGGRYMSVGETDASGSLWLFGGNGSSQSVWGYLNDLWKFTPK
jgi:N-acetylneuraminic acid mutarotase